MNPMNKTMDRADLFTAEACALVEELNNLIRFLYSKGLHMTSWYGTLPGTDAERFKVTNLLRALLAKRDLYPSVGIPNRGPDYEALPGAADDARIPWYLYWEIYWVLMNGPKLHVGVKLLDAGGASSLFSCYATGLVEEVANKLRAGIERPELGL